MPEDTPHAALKVLVFGTTGQVARELRRRAPDDIDLVAVDRASADFTSPLACAEAITRTTPDAIINAVAFTAVDAAETQEPLATTINGTTPGALARTAARADIPFVQISTDYVFDGSGTAAWAPDAPTSPLGAYGRSKLVGEQQVRAAGPRHVILRTSWVFSSHGNNFVKTMLRLSETHATLRVVADQIGGPTPASAIADACLILARKMAQDPTLGGTYHFSGTPDLSWADFARKIFAMAGKTTTVTDIPATAYPTPAARPANSRLDGSTLARDFGILRPDWTQGLAAVLDDLGEQT